MSLYYGGRILTMVGETRETVKYVEAVVEKDGKITFAGSLSHAKRIFRGINEVNLEGRTMMPGHIDPHLHPSMASLILKMDFITPFDWDLPNGKFPGVRTEQGYRDRLTKLITQRNYVSSRQDFLITWGYHPSFHGKMAKGVIDQLKPLVPVVVWHRSFHEVYLGTIALEQLKYDDLDELKKNPQVEWDSGHFFEMGLDALLSTTSFKDHVFPLMEEGYKDLVQVIHQNGITTVGDLEFPLIDLDLEKSMASKNLKSKDVFFSTYCVCSARNFSKIAGKDHEKAKTLIQDLAKEFSDDQVIVYKDHVKALCDGAFFSQLMQMEDGYSDGHSGQWITEPDELAKLMEVYWNSKPKGFQIHVHTNGDLGMAKLLEIVEHLKTMYPRKDRGTTVEHAGYFTKKQADKIAELGLRVSAAPYYLHTLAEKYSSEKEGIGKARAEAMSPLRWLFDNGVVTALHSDFTMAPSKPLLLAWCAVNRVTAEGNCFRKDLAITPYEGLLGITKNAAIILGTDDIMGTIEEGKLANFTILEKDPLEVEPMEIKDIKIYASVYKGRMNSIRT
ncbi:uncharacterized protein LOC116298266 [Actinia tenebrosa]|uniref:Uncharacterized protein LOC116298266 n=1 Tax=Actinia tenebrosa TaxID=6105 RepID=A0A6P8I4W3_ACTTE|nr:uncharacterized protein LOC116298266 [Actinia tenebrosa]